MSSNHLDNHKEWLYKRLEILLATAKIWPTGEVLETKQLVDKIGKIKIHVYSKEHAPAHFHIVANNFSAAFSIETCELIKGKLPSDKQKIIKYWYSKYKSELIAAWNETRPTDCPVGKIA